MAQFIVFADLQLALASITGKLDSTGLVSSLDPKWTEPLTAGLNFGYNAIVSGLAIRGFSPAQIAGWDRGAEFQRDLGLYHALREGRVIDPGTYDTAMIDKLDRRMELMTVAVTVGGVWQDPANDVGQPVTGPYATATDMYVEDMNDPRRGQVTRW